MDSVRKALAGEYDFEVKAVLKEGWEITQRDKMAMLQGMGVTVLIALMVIAFAYEYSLQKGIDFNATGFRAARDIIMMILVAPFAAGLMMMGVNASIGAKVRGSHVIQYLHKAFSIIVASVLISAFVQIGMLFFILPGLYLIIATGFTIPLVLDKGFMPSRALLISIKVVNKQWRKFVQLYLIFFALLLLVFATFGLAMIWVAPFYYNAKGLLYRDIFGVVVDRYGNELSLNYSNTTSRDDSEVTPSKADTGKTEAMPESTQTNGGVNPKPGKDEYFDA